MASLPKSPLRPRGRQDLLLLPPRALPHRGSLHSLPLYNSCPPIPLLVEVRKQNQPLTTHPSPVPGIPPGFLEKRCAGCAGPATLSSCLNAAGVLASPPWGPALPCPARRGFRGLPITDAGLPASKGPTHGTRTRHRGRAGSRSAGLTFRGACRHASSLPRRGRPEGSKPASGGRAPCALSLPEWSHPKSEKMRPEHKEKSGRVTMERKGWK